MTQIITGQIRERFSIDVIEMSKSSTSYDAERLCNDESLQVPSQYIMYGSYIFGRLHFNHFSLSLDRHYKSNIRVSIFLSFRLLF